MFSGGSYREVARWLGLFLNSHAKRENPRVEATVEAVDAREATYVVSLRYGDRVSGPHTLDAKAVAAQRGDLAWCAALAAQARGWARSVLSATDPAPALPSGPAASTSGPERPGAPG